MLGGANFISVYIAPLPPHHPHSSSQTPKTTIPPHSITALAIAHFREPDAPLLWPNVSAPKVTALQKTLRKLGRLPPPPTPEWTEGHAAPKEVEVWGLKNLSSAGAMEETAVLLGRCVRLSVCTHVYACDFG